MSLQCTSKNFYVVDAQGFTIGGEFHARELYFTNAFMSFGIELDLGLSYRQVLAIPEREFRTITHQSDIHGLFLRSRRHSMVRPMVNSRHLGAVCSIMYDVFTEAANGNSKVVFAVKNDQLLRLLKKEPSIKHLIDLGDPQYGIPKIANLESQFPEWKTTCAFHNMERCGSYRCAQAKTMMLMTYIMKNKLFGISDIELGNSLGNMATMVLDASFFDSMVKARMAIGSSAVGTAATSKPESSNSFVEVDLNGNVWDFTTSSETQEINLPTTASESVVDTTGRPAQVVDPSFWDTDVVKSGKATSEERSELSPHDQESHMESAISDGVASSAVLTAVALATVGYDPFGKLVIVEKLANLKFVDQFEKLAPDAV